MKIKLMLMLAIMPCVSLALTLHTVKNKYTFNPKANSDTPLNHRICHQVKINKLDKCVLVLNNSSKPIVVHVGEHDHQITIEKNEIAVFAANPSRKVLVTREHPQSRIFDGEVHDGKAMSITCSQIHCE